MSEEEIYYSISVSEMIDQCSLFGNRAISSPFLMFFPEGVPELLPILGNYHVALINWQVNEL